jgi:hypothetical protein
LLSDRSVLLEAVTDPEVPPLPPHITLKQAKAFASTLWTGDPREGSVITQTAGLLCYAPVWRRRWSSQPRLAEMVGRI